MEVFYIDNYSAFYYIEKHMDLDNNEHNIINFNFNSKTKSNDFKEIINSMQNSLIENIFDESNSDESNSDESDSDENLEYDDFFDYSELKTDSFNTSNVINNNINNDEINETEENYENDGSDGSETDENYENYETNKVDENKYINLKNFIFTKKINFSYDPLNEKDKLLHIDYKVLAEAIPNTYEFDNIPNIIFEHEIINVDPINDLIQEKLTPEIYQVITEIYSMFPEFIFNKEVSETQTQETQTQESEIQETETQETETQETQIEESEDIIDLDAIDNMKSNNVEEVFNNQQDFVPPSTFNIPYINFKNNFGLSDKFITTSTYALNTTYHVVVFAASLLYIFKFFKKIFNYNQKYYEYYDSNMYGYYNDKYYNQFKEDSSVETEKKENSSPEDNEPNKNINTQEKENSEATTSETLSSDTSSEEICDDNTSKKSNKKPIKKNIKKSKDNTIE
jgi:hypothetical protein